MARPQNPNPAVVKAFALAAALWFNTHMRTHSSDARFVENYTGLSNLPITLSWINGLAASLTLAALLLAALAMPAAIMSMEHHEVTSIENCPLMFDKYVTCTMSYLEHILLWNSLFVAIPSEFVIVIFLALAAGHWLRFGSYGPPILSSYYQYIILRHDRIWCSILLHSVVNPRAP